MSTTFLYLSKLLPVFIYPVGLSILLMLAGLAAPKRFARWLGGCAVAVLAVFSCPILSQRLLGSLESQFPESNIADMPSAEAIVVLGGMVRIPTAQHPNAELNEASDRLRYAVRLFRAGKAPVVLVSGGNLSGERETTEAQAGRSLLLEWGVPGEAVLMEGESRNTRENATFTNRVLSQRQIRRILLVTSAFHMKRAAAVFRKVGFEVLPAPADFRTGWGEPIWGWLPTASALADSEIALKEWLGLVTYKVSGWV